MNNKTGNNITWQLISDIHTLSKIKEQWQSFAQQSSNPNPFSFPEWILNWYQVYWQKNWELATLVGYINNELVLVFPFYIQHSRQWPHLKVMYPLGQGEPEEAEISSEYCDVIISSRFENIILLELIEKLAELSVDQIICNAVLQNSHIIKFLEKAYEYKAPTSHYRYRINCSKWTLQDLSKNTRSRYKRSNNQLKKINAKFHWVNSEDYMRYTALLIEYHQSLWEGRGYKGAFSHPNFKSFHNNYRSQHSVKISAITVDNIPIAINYYFSDETTLYFYQCGWDSNNYANFSLGLALHLWSIENCHHKYYDFMMGDIKHSYKSKYGAQQEPMTNIAIEIKPRKVFINKLIRRIISL
ncbi:MAG: hypothetical protein COB45_02610 [Gammaproteobacteria bacterium]|nr:MAG: hypothetical protein COB45_02610 [Gammaproteobacteria bacterium]